MTLKLTTTKTTVHYVNMLVYGESGIGKTTLCKTAPAPIIISAEKGLLSLADVDIPVVEVHNIKDIDEVYTYLLKNTQYQTVCIDSLSELSEVVLAEAKATIKDGRMAYGAMADKMMHITRLFRDLPNKHTYFIAKQKRMTDEATGKMSYVASVPGQSYANNLPYFFDVVACMRIGKKDKDEYRYLQTQPGLQYEAKDRSGKLAKEEKPDLTYIINKIVGN